MTGITLLHEIPGGSQVTDSYTTIVAPNEIDIPLVEGLVIPKGSRGQILKYVDANIAVVRWEVSMFILLFCL